MNYTYCHAWSSIPDAGTLVCSPFAPSFVGKTLNLTLQATCFDKFTITSLMKLVDGDREMLLIPARAIKR